MHLYETYYTALQFERAGLFKVIQERYGCKDVLYPGCSVHVTPSLYFPHVVYVDQSEAAAKFFADERTVMQFVNRNKRYTQSAYIRFIQQDYSQPLPLRQKNYDLLLALFAGGIAGSCITYLKPGGFLLTNNHQGDAVDASKNEELKVLAVIRFQKQAYVIAEGIPQDLPIPLQRQNHAGLKQAGPRIEYVENEVYYLFRRVR